MMLLDLILDWRLWSALFATSVIALITYGFYPWDRYRLRHIPGPLHKLSADTWLVGNIAEHIKLGGIFASHVKYARDYGPIFVARNVHKPIVMVESPELARKVLLQNNYRCVFPNLLHGRDAKFEESTYLDTRGDKLRIVRGAWQPFFFSGSLENFQGLMQNSADLLVESVALSAKSGEYCDIHAMVGAMTVQVVGTTAFGVDFHTQAADSARQLNSADVDKLLTAVYDIMAPKAFSFSVYTPLLILFPFAGPMWKEIAHWFPDEGLTRVKNGRRVVIDIVSRLMAERRAEMAAEQTRAAKGLSKLRTSISEVTGEKRGVAPGSFVDLLVNATDKATGMSLTDLERTNQAFVMVLSAYETTANSLAFTLYLLSKAENRKKLDRLCAEVDAFGRDATPQFDELDRFPWLEACLREAMRMFPPVPTLTREAERDMDLGKYKIQKGEMLGVAVFSMHNNPAYWQEPERYLPERFMEGTPEYAAKPQHGYLPFGDGQRQCIGLRFAIMEAKITLIRLFQRFTFDLKEGQDKLDLRETITISAADGVHVRAMPRPPPNKLF